MAMPFSHRYISWKMLSYFSKRNYPRRTAESKNQKIISFHYSTYPQVKITYVINFINVLCCDFLECFGCVCEVR